MEPISAAGRKYFGMVLFALGGAESIASVANKFFLDLHMICGRPLICGILIFHEMGIGAL